MRAPGRHVGERGEREGIRRLVRDAHRRLAEAGAVGLHRAPRAAAVARIEVAVVTALGTVDVSITAGRRAAEGVAAPARLGRAVWRAAVAAPRVAVVTCLDAHRHAVSAPRLAARRL